MSVVLEGWGTPTPARMISQGFGLPPGGVIVRETFSVPPGEGRTAVRAAGATGTPSIGSTEAGITFALNVVPWLGTGELLTTLSATVWADPIGAGAPSNATSSVLQAHRTLSGTTAIVTLHSAQARTVYVITCSVQTTASRTLQCDLPRIWCPA